jgi:hypothetical protein
LLPSPPVSNWVLAALRRFSHKKGAKKLFKTEKCGNLKLRFDADSICIVFAPNENLTVSHVAGQGIDVSGSHWVPSS